MRETTSKTLRSGKSLVIVPVFNRPRRVLACLDAVARQSISPAELIVVDDGSSDGTPASVAAWLRDAQLDFSARLICLPRNCGISVACNTAVEQASPCEYLALIGSDDVWPHDFLQRCEAALDGETRAVAATADRSWEYADGRLEWEDLSLLAQDAGQFFLTRYPGIVSCTLMRRAMWDEAGGYDADLRTGQDTAMLFPLAMRHPWLHVAGEAVKLRRDPLPGEAKSLSEPIPNRFRLWADIYDRTVRQYWQRFHRPFVRKQMSERYQTAGRELEAKRLYSEAAYCYFRACCYGFQFKKIGKLAKCLTRIPTQRLRRAT